MDNPIDNIGKNEKLLRASKDFQKLGEGKKRRRLLKEAQRKDGTYKGPKSKPWTPERIEEERIAEEKRRERLLELERGSYFERPEGMSDEEYTRKIVEMEAEKSGILPASPRINVKPTGRVSADFYTPRSNPYNSTKKPPEVKKGPRGGRYTEDKTKDGRPYRRYF